VSQTDKHMENFYAKKMRQGECIEATIKGYMPGKKKDSTDALMTGRLILTDQRVCFYRKGIIGEKFESIDLGNITSIESSSLLGHRTVKLYSTHNDLAFNSFKSKDEFDPVVAQIETRINQKNVPEASAGPAASNPSAQLEKLAALHTSGILTLEEFTAKKTEILSRI